PKPFRSGAVGIPAELAPRPFSKGLRCGGGFEPITTSALHHASVSSAIKKSAKAETFAGRARAVGEVQSAFRQPPIGEKSPIPKTFLSRVDDLTQGIVWSRLDQV